MHEISGAKGRAPSQGKRIELQLTGRQYRRLLDMVYIGNWILNSARGDDRFADYDRLQEFLFAQAGKVGMDVLTTFYQGTAYPSEAYQKGGIHEAIADYEDAVFFDILAEELARRDMEREGVNPDNEDDLASRMEEYYQEFEAHGIDNITFTE